MKVLRRQIFFIIMVFAFAVGASGCSKNGVQTLMQDTLIEKQEASAEENSGKAEENPAMAGNGSDILIDENLKETMITELNEFFAILYAEKLELGDPGLIYSDNENEQNGD